MPCIHLILLLSVPVTLLAYSQLQSWPFKRYQYSATKKSSFVSLWIKIGSCAFFGPAGSDLSICGFVFVSELISIAIVEFVYVTNETFV